MLAPTRFALQRTSRSVVQQATPYIIVRLLATTPVVAGLMATDEDVPLGVRTKTPVVKNVYES